MFQKPKYLMFFNLLTGLRMRRKDTLVTDEEWKILEQKIKIYQEHIKSFQTEVEERLEH